MATAGGSLTGIEQAAQLSVFGLDPWHFLKEKDPIERALILELAKKIQKSREIDQKNLASMIAEQVGKLFTK